MHGVASATVETVADSIQKEDIAVRHRQLGL
jgi:hypothetical protein